MKAEINKRVKVLLVTNSIILLAVAMLGPIYALFVDEIGGSLLDASLAAGVFALVAGVVTLLSGRRVDQVKNKGVIVIIGYLIISVGFLLYTVVDSIYSLLVVQVIIGLGEAVYSPAFDTLYAKHIDRKKAGYEWGMWEALNYFSLAVGAIIGGLVVTNFGFNTLFVVMSLFCFSSAFYLYVLPEKYL